MEGEQAPTPQWAIWVNVALGTLVVTVGLWLMWGELSTLLTGLVALGVTGFLVWRGTTVARVWAWATLLLGVECFAWPVVTMIRVRMETAEPTEQQMGDMLTSVLFGLVSAIFWTTFSYGIFRLMREREAKANPQLARTEGRAAQRTGKKKRGPR